MQAGQERKYSGDEVLTRLEDGKYSLLDVLMLHEKMNIQRKKMSHGLKVAVWTCGICAIVLLLFLIVGALLTSGQTDSGNVFGFIILLILSILLFFIVTLLFCKFLYIDKPQRQYQNALAKGYPGLDPQNNESIQEYIRALENDHQKFVAALCSWIEWKYRCARKSNSNMDMDMHEILHPHETVLLYAMEASSKDALSSVYDRYGDATGYYVGKFDSALRQIKAIRAADIWREALPVIKRMNSLDGETYAADSGILADLETQMIDCRNETVELVYRYVMRNKSSFI